MQYKKRAFELGKQPAGRHVDEDAEGDDGPVEEGDVPVLRDVGVGLAKHEEALDEAAGEEGA